MSDDRELVERLATIDATPRARWVAEFRADLDAAWETEGLGDVDSLRRTTVTLVDNGPAPSEPSTGRRWTSLIVAAAAVVFVVGVLVVFDRDDAPPADQPSPTVTVPPVTPPPPRALFGTLDELLAPGTYFVDEVAGTPTPRIFVTIGTGWSTGSDREGIGRGGRGGFTPDDRFDVGVISFSRPDRVYLDACHLSDGFHPGPVDTVDGLVAALTEQQGWAEVSAPLDISVDGYSGKTFQRTVPDPLSGCPNMTPGHMRLPELDGNGLNSWLNEDSSSSGGYYYEPGQVETLMVLDIDGTVDVIHSNLWAGSSAADRAEFAAVLDSIRIARALPNVPSDEQALDPGTYYVDEVNGTPTPRLFATLDSGWFDLDTGPGWAHIAKGRVPSGVGHVAISNPVAVYSDACHPTDGFYPGSVATVDGVVTALREQQGGWADVTTPSDISVDGYVGKAFQRTAPADMSDCTAWDGSPRSSGQAVFPSWQSAEGVNDGSAPGQIQTLWVLDLDGTVVIITTELWPGPSATAHADFADAMLDSIQIDRP